ncbi:hypothetical protein [Aquipuribacter sp. SD81]|uniref:hypothetical protein n=1 Tax=Aquipuribacter sp. SD81 TaxID=3127703 RepID=UPI00301844CD
MVSLTTTHPRATHRTAHRPAARERWTAFRARLAEQRRLERELAAYRTPAERAEVLAMIGRAHATGVDPVEVERTLAAFERSAA